MSRKYMKYISSGELKEVAILAFCLGILESEKDIIFIDEEHTKRLDEIYEKMKDVVSKYKEHRKYILTNAKKYLDNVAKIPYKKRIHLTLLALEMLFITFPINERDKPLSDTLQKFWSDIKTNVENLTNKYYDDINEDILAETMNFAYILKESVR